MLSKDSRFHYKDILLPNDTDDEIIENVNTKIQRYMQFSRRLRRQWLVNAAMARGNQFSVLYGTESHLIQLPETSGRRKVQDDMISPWIQHMVANMMMARPDYEAIPENRNTDSVTAARMATNVLRYYWDDWRFIEKDVMINIFLLIFGNAFCFINYIPDSKSVSTPVLDESMQPVLDDENMPVFDQHFVGDLTSQIFMPDQVLCNLDPSPLEQKPWVIVRVRRSLDYYRNHPIYGKVKKDGKLAVDMMMADSMSTADADDISRISRGRENDASMVADGADENLYMQLPSHSNDKGMVAVVAGGQLLFKKDWTFKKLTTYPIEHFHGIKEPGEFYARTSLERQIPLQKGVNILNSIVITNAVDMAHQKVIIHNDCGVDSISDTTGVIRGDWLQAWQEPHIMDIKPLPDYIETRIAAMKASIRDIQSFHGASAGGAVSGVRSNVHADNLQDQDLLPLHTMDNLKELSYSRLGEKILTIVAEKITDERALVFTDGNGRDITIENFRGAMLGNVRKVRVRMMNQHLRSRSATLQNIYNYFAAGMITDQFGNPDPIKVMSMIEFAMPDDMLRDYKIHSNRAYKENDRLMRGEPTIPHAWENHRIHLTVHQEHQNSAEFMALVEAAEAGDAGATKIVERFNEHVEATAQMQAEALSGLAPPEGEQTSQEQTKQGQQPKQEQQSQPSA